MRQASGKDVRMVEADIYGLDGADRQAAIAALSSGAEFPLVIVEGVLVCSAALDAALITEAVRAATP